MLLTVGAVMPMLLGRNHHLHSTQPRSNTSAATASSTEKSVAVNGAAAAATDASATTAQTNASAVMSHAQNSATLSMPLNLGSVIGITLTGAVSLCASIVW